MAIRYKALTELYQEMQRSVTAPDQWRAFLASACRNYRLSFYEQLLVYAQRPDATAVLEIERWNRQFGRWVNRGANGIAVFDGEHNGKPRLKYYFDISDTHEARFPRPVPLWTVREEYAPDIIETLENSFGELENKEDLGEALLSAAKNAVEDNMPDYLSELKTLTEGSFLEELDELNLEVEYRRAVQNSIGYMLLVRCGLDPSDYFEDEDFRDVLNFNTPQTLNALGVATGDISQMCLSAISRTILALQRQPQKENRTFEPQQKIQYAVTEQENTQPERSFEYDRDHLHQAGRLQSAEPSAAPGGAGSPWEIRIASEEVPQGAPQGNVHQPVDQRQAEQPSGGDPADRPAPDGADRGADGQGSGRDGGTESQQPDEMGGSDEQPAERGGGNGTGRTDLQLIEEPEESAGGEQRPAFLDEKQIMAIIANKDDDLKYKKNQIELFFSVHSDVQERAEYLKSAYQDRYTEIIADGQRLGYKPQENGLLMWEGSYLSRTKESVFSWEVVAGWTAQLIDKKEYFIQTDIPRLPDQESQQMSLFDFTEFNRPASSEQADLQPKKEEALPLPPKRPRRERITFTTLHPEVPRDQRHDFHITDDALGHGTPSEKYAANVAAIRTLKQIEAEERLATPEEQEILSRYVGWGGLANCFEQTSPHYEELKSLLDSEEYAAARASSLTAFYTPPVVIRGIYKALAQMGFTQGNILDKTTPRLIQFHTLKNAANPPFLGGFLIFDTVAA